MIFDSLQSFEFHDMAVEVRTKSGRKFRYHVHEYVRQLHADSTEAHAWALATTATNEKYREAGWDRKHRLVNVEKEICDALYIFLLDRIEALKRFRTKQAPEQPPHEEKIKDEKSGEFKLAVHKLLTGQLTEQEMKQYFELSPGGGALKMRRQGPSK